MTTIIFDFDSTLISHESLEEILRPKLSQEELILIQQLTKDAMNGQISFRQALEKRLNTAFPTRQEVLNFAQQIPQFLSKGMEAFIGELRQESIDIWVISGGLREALLPTCRQLGIPDEKVHAVSPEWGSEGDFQGLRLGDPSADSKVAVAEKFSHQWSRPVIGVGDGMTDYELYEKGFEDHFIVYAEHAERPNLLATGAPVARSVEELRQGIYGVLSDANKG